ncbi:MAG: alkylhydroperoxidase family enzyme [Acidimicrobiales bacterium]|jgi:alkylhydroperoxidase family enzyme
MVWSADVDVRVRDDLVEAQRLAWSTIGACGTWWTGAERVAIAEVVVAAVTDPEPLAPWVARSSVADQRMPENLPAAAIDAAYRLARSPGTLTGDWYRSIIGAGLTPGQYVELVTLVVRVAAIQRFATILGAELPPLPEPAAGQPSRSEPTGLDQHHHWVPIVRPADADEELDWLYSGGFAPNVRRALSAVPESYRQINPLQQAGYLPMGKMMALDWHRPGLDRRQMELVAAKTSQVNECFY